jgi:hypothetical protein
MLFALGYQMTPSPMKYDCILFGYTRRIIEFSQLFQASDEIKSWRFHHPVQFPGCTNFHVVFKASVVPRRQLAYAQQYL